MSAPRLGSEPASERGAGTVLVLGLVAVAVLLGVALGALASVQSARGAAQTAADLAALAGASAARIGEDPCAVATETAERNGARLVRCADQGGAVVQVETERSRSGAGAVLDGVVGPASAQARAGPRSARDA